MNILAIKSVIGKIKQTLVFIVMCFYVLVTNQVSAAEKITFYHYDLLGSPVATTNEAGEVIWREEYSPYGDKLLNQDVSSDNVRGYTGHVHDAETGLTYMQARYYDPEIGRFMGIDPVGFQEDNPIMFNRYAYANNNPYKYVDPNGEFALIGASIGATLDYGAQVMSNFAADKSTIAAFTDVNISSIAISAVLGSVGVVGLNQLSSGVKGVYTVTNTLGKAVEKVNLTTKVERSVMAVDGALKSGLIGAALAEKNGKDSTIGAGAKIIDGITHPVPAGTITTIIMNEAENIMDTLSEDSSEQEGYSGE